MRSRVLSIAIIMISGIAAAQTPNSGTNSNTQQTPQTNASDNIYIVAPPQISLGDGITPTVVTNQGNVTATTTDINAANGPTIQANTQAAALPTDGDQQHHFDFVTSGSANGDGGSIAGSMNDSSVSLGEVAREYRHGQQLPKRTISNADVDALNSQNGGGSAANSNGMSGSAISGPANQQQQPMNGSASQNTGGVSGTTGNQAPAYAQPATRDPFGAPPQQNTNGGSNATRKPSGSTDSGTSNESSQPNQSNNTTDQQQLPKSSTSLPLLATLGGASFLVGITYLKMR